MLFSCWLSLKKKKKNLKKSVWKEWIELLEFTMLSVTVSYSKESAGAEVWEFGKGISGTELNQSMDVSVQWCFNSHEHFTVS